MRRHAEFAVALGALVAGSGGSLLASLPTWQTLSVPRAHPLSDVVVDVSGREVDSALTALGLVALAGVVAVLATRGPWRRGVGVVIVLAGIGLVVRAVLALGAVDAARARSLIEGRRRTVDVAESVLPHVDVSAVWPVLSILCGIVVAAAGALVAVRGGQWQAMSARYESSGGVVDVTPDPVMDEARAAASMWSALDRGEDPTSG
ncbi:MAG: Trp biosynthesis-associated membrane protein [Jatrophihabitans sp.]